MGVAAVGDAHVALHTPFGADESRQDLFNRITTLGEDDRVIERSDLPPPPRHSPNGALPTCQGTESWQTNVSPVPASALTYRVSRG